MKVLVDTSIWSLVLRKKKLTNDEIKIVNELKELIQELRVAIIGPIRQEVISGISNQNIFLKLKKHLSYFEDDLLESIYFEKAAEIYNLCRSNGIQGSHTDYLICSVVNLNNYCIFTLDKDFKKYSKYVDLKFHVSR